MALEHDFAEQLRESESTATPIIEKSQSVSEPEVIESKQNDDSVDSYNKMIEIIDELKSLRSELDSLGTVIKKCGKDNLDQIVTRIDKFEEGLSVWYEKKENKGGVEHSIKIIREIVERNHKTLTRVLEYNDEFQTNVRQRMGDELDKLRKEKEKEQNAPLMKQVAVIYIDYLNLLKNDESLSDKTRKNIDSLFEDIETFFEENGAEIIESSIGSTRRTMVSKVNKTIPTGDESLHNTVVRSLHPGVVLNRVVLVPEAIDVYKYDNTLKEEKNPTEDEHTGSEETSSVIDGEVEESLNTENIEKDNGGNE